MHLFKVKFQIRLVGITFVTHVTLKILLTLMNNSHMSCSMSLLSESGRTNGTLVRFQPKVHCPHVGTLKREKLKTDLNEIFLQKTEKIPFDALSQTSQNIAHIETF